MRVSSGMIFDAGVQSMQKQSAALLSTQQQVASGRRILSPSDDPVAAARALEVSQAQSSNSQYLLNQKAAGEALGLQDGALTSVTDLIQAARTLAVQAGSPVLNASDRQSIAGELRERFDELLGLANGKDAGGQSLFAGYMGGTTPFAGSVAGGVAYAGDSGQRMLQVSASRQIAISDAGSDVFMRIRSGNGTFSTAAAATNAGSGVIDAGSVVGAFVPDTYTITFAPAGPGLNYTVTGTVSGVVAAGAFQSGQAMVFNGASVAITGTPAATDQFTVTSSTGQSLFATLANLITAIEAPVSGGNTLLSNRLGSALRNLDQAQDNILAVRAAVGARQNEVDALASAGADLDLQYAQVLSRLQDVDYAEALSRLTQQQTYLEAAQKSFLKVSGLSLFNFV